ncbi:Hormone-sensitive lipase-like [Oopsacas minuta]|uniref:Hormone-sensitive lipase n=1 Tax=Oopsacas minuta TaxID=111878 RepID=A0AAV7JT15_9METZ|nr:Hormone-sensitive lipase-like [Oopsacas minuta]
MATQPPRLRSRSLASRPVRRSTPAPLISTHSSTSSGSFVDLFKQLSLKEMKMHAPSIWKHELGALNEDCSGPLGVSQDNYTKDYVQIISHLDVATKFYSSERADTDKQFYTVLLLMRVVTDIMKQLMDEMFVIAPNYDFIDNNNEPVIGNGYRTLLHTSERCLKACLRDLQDFAKARSSRSYNCNKHYRHLTTVYRLLLAKVLLIDQSLQIQMYSKQDCLLADRDKLPDGFIDRAIALPIENFYGRHMGLQYSNLLRPILNMLVVAMVTLHDCKNTTNENIIQQAASTMVYGGQYMLGDPEVRAKKVARMSIESDIRFTKNFWSISESISVREVMGMLGHPAGLSEEITIAAKPIEYVGENGHKVVLTPPFKGMGYEPLRARLISYLWRDGQERTSNLLTRKPNLYAKASGLIIHFHGGGFVAQSPKSHELYLRSWSEHLNVPILSVDYSKAPEGHYPRPMEEGVFAYTWALLNLHKLGTTGERIIIAGDSAGGNISLATSLKVVSLGIRPPDSICIAYPVTYIDRIPSPSRMLSLLDPVLPFGILLSCLSAYTGEINQMLDIDNDKKREMVCDLSRFAKELDLKSNPFLYESSHSLLPKSTPKRPAPPFSRTNSDGAIVQFESDTDSTKSFDMYSISDLDCFHDIPETMSFSSCETLTGSFTTTDNCDVKPKRIPPPRPPPPKDSSHSIASFRSLDIVVSEEIECPNYLPTPKPIYYSVAHLANALAKPYDVVKKQDAVANTMDSSDYISSSSDDERALALIEQSEQDSYHSCDDDSGSEDELNKLEDLLCVKCKQVVSNFRESAPNGTIDNLFNGTKNTEQNTNSLKSDPFLSPYLATPEMFQGMPPVYIYASALDPLLDDSVEFAKKLKAIGHPVYLSISQTLPHGFLSLALSQKSGPGEANELFMQYLRQALLNEEDD